MIMHRNESMRIEIALALGLLSSDGQLTRRVGLLPIDTFDTEGSPWK